MAERKRYIEINIPFLRESIKALGTVDELHNRTISLDLAIKLRGKGLTIKFRINKFDDSLVAIPNKLELNKSYIKKMMRKRTDYVEDSFKASCADGSVVMKPFLITRKRVSRAVRRNLRNTAREFLLDYCKDKDFNDVCIEIYTGTLQKALLPKLKKVYPLGFCDIRVFEGKELEKVDISKILSHEISDETPIVEEDSQESTSQVDGNSEEGSKDESSSEGDELQEGVEQDD